MSYANTNLSEDEQGWVNACADRLRLIQADAALSSPGKRHEYLQEELDRSLKQVSVANRKRFLEVLVCRFPVRGVAGRTETASAPAPKPVEETFEQVTERFLTMAAQLSQEQRTELARRLYGEGISWVDRDRVVLEVAEELRVKLGLPEGQHPELNRIMELTVFLVEEVSLLQQNALRTMHELSPKSPVLRRVENFKKTVAKYLVSEDESIEAQWQNIRSLLGVLLAATMGGGKEFSKQFVERLSPQAIEYIIVGEGSSVFGPSRKEKCWEKYKDISKDYATPDLVNKQIKESMVAFIENTVAPRR